MPITSMNGSSYVLNFIDDFSRYTWVFLIKKKTVIENAFGPKIKILRFDNGGEYVSNDLIHIYFQSGIQVQH